MPTPVRVIPPVHVGTGRPGPQARLDRTVAAVVFDWDGTAVRDRRVSARAVRWRLERLSELGVHAAVVSGTHLGNVDGQLQARPRGPGRLLLGLNRGSELFEVVESGPRLLSRVEETAEVTSALDRTAAEVVRRLRAVGLEVELVSHRLNRRKIDLIPVPAWADPPKARLAELVDAVSARLRAAGIGSIAEVARLASIVAAGEGLVPRVTSDAKHVEIGVTDKSDSVRSVLEFLGRFGVDGELVLVVGDEFGEVAGMPGSDSLLVVPGLLRATVVSVGAEPAGVPPGVDHLGGGPDTFLALLDEQLHRAAKLRVPEVDQDPRWTLVERGVDVARHRVTESLFTLASGGVGFRGSVEESPDYGQPLVVAAGVYSGRAFTDGLLPGPDVVDVRLDPPVQEDLRTLDLRTGALHRSEQTAVGVPVRSLRFASLSEPGLLALRLEGQTGRVHPGGPARGTRSLLARSALGGIGAAVRQELRRDGDVTALQRLVAVDVSTHGVPSLQLAHERLDRVGNGGFERLLADQRAGWSARWDAVNVEIPDDPEVELGLRFVLFQLWGLSEGTRELAVGARALTGSGYAGHVFWDADVFVLPALVTVDPPSAGAMVDYRLNRLGAARERARAEGRAGARFPWESAYDGHDVTPEQGRIGGEPVPILTGLLEEHITADVAWAVVRHALWTRPSGRLGKDEAELLRYTARYWVSRIETDEDGTGHLRDVIGPDEYHEHVDDNAFTNTMARWNLRVAAQRAPADVEERADWVRSAAALVDGYDPVTGLYEQFRGYFDLRPMQVRELAEPPVAADVLAGRDAIAASQVVKQPDALMIHRLVPEAAAPGSLQPNLEFYAPRTAHGSSLSPATMACLHARAGEPDTALELLRLSLRIDLDDVGGTTAAGVHVGACGAAWQTLVHGFLGAGVEHGCLVLDPVLPSTWTRLDVRFRCLGSRVHVHVGPDALSVDTSSPLAVFLAPGSPWRGRTLSGIRLHEVAR